MSDIPTFKFALKDDHHNEDQFLPTRAHDTDTGWDVRCAVETRIKPGEHVIIPLGFRVFAPPGWWLELRPRSSSFIKRHLHALYGVIDETYEGEVGFCTQLQWKPKVSYISLSLSDRPVTITIGYGEKIGQLIPVRRQNMNVDKISNEEFNKLTNGRAASRGAGGFGSSG